MLHQLLDKLEKLIRWMIALEWIPQVWSGEL
jgi:hypothetical protein